MKVLRLFIIVVFCLGIILMNIQSVSARGFYRHQVGKHYNYGHHKHHRKHRHSRRHIKRHVPRHSYVKHRYSKRHLIKHVPRRRYYKKRRYGNYYSINRGYGKNKILALKRRRANIFRLYALY